MKSNSGLALAIFALAAVLLFIWVAFGKGESAQFIETESIQIKQ